MEKLYYYATIEQARNAAIEWLEARGVVFGPHRKVQIGKFGDLAGKEVGVESSDGLYYRIRLDFDPAKHAHFNAEVGKGSVREKAAFLFRGGPELIARLAMHRQPR